MGILEDFYMGEVKPWEDFGFSDDPVYRMYAKKIEQLEWRYACYEKNLGVLDNEKGKLISVPLPKKIIFGKNMSEENKIQILSWIKEKRYNIAIQQM